ncbi:MAG: NAD(P)H-hydrate dehydratase [Candidatus Binatia bacterium]
MNLHGAAASVLDRESMRRLDELTIAAGTASLDLMETAGEAIADGLADSALHGVPLLLAPRLLVVAGSGNNGGDGFVVARLLAARGWECTVGLAAGPPREGGDAAANLAAWEDAGGEVFDRARTMEALRSGGAGFDLGLDAVFGTGLARPVEGPDAELIHCLNRSGLPFVAADIPSGLCADTGVPLGVAVRCRATVTIGAAKPGLFLDDGPDHAGRVRVADIGLLDPAESGLSRQGVVLDPATTAGAMPRLSSLAHKGSRGHVLIVAGSRGKTGAALLAARGALRAGAGLVTVAGVPEVQAAVAVALPEAMTLGLAANGDGSLTRDAAQVLVAAARGVDCVVFGPGVGTGAGADAALALLVAEPVALVLDADGLNLVSAWGQDRRSALFDARSDSGAPRAILTPHPGEMGRLVERTSAHVQLSRKVLADNLARELGAVVVLKGAATVISDGSVTAFNLSGNAGMACAGMGDVLAGVCGALAARGLDPLAAAALAVFVHGEAGDLLAEEIGGPGFLAGELADTLPVVLASRLPL